MTTAPRTSVLYALRTWLLPVALGAGAFGVHYALHVPRGPLPPPSPAQLEAEKKAAEKAKKEEEKLQREADRKAGKVRPSERSGAKDLPYEAFTRAREQYLLDQLWEYYEPKSFKGEPTFEAWQTAHKSLLGQIVSATRQAVLPEGPAIVVAANECHTIRCRFTISAPEAEPLTTLNQALEKLELDGRSLWHSYKPGKLVEEPAKKEGAAPRHKQEITVSFIRDLPPLERIQLPGEGPLRVAPPRPAGSDAADPTGKLSPIPSRPAVDTSGKPATGAAARPPIPGATPNPGSTSAAKPGQTPTGPTARPPAPNPSTAPAAKPGQTPVPN